MTRVSSGMRIKYEKQGDLLVSVRIFSNGRRVVKLVIDTKAMTYSIQDVMTNYVYEQGGGVTNMEVLQRKAKKHLKEFLDIYFEKETRCKTSQP